MICTFGDLTDVVWWRELGLPIRAIIGSDGRVISLAPDIITSPAGRDAYERLAGKTIFSARQAVVELLRESNTLLDEPRSIVHSVKFFEKGDRPLEIISTRQWYVTNGAHDEALRARCLELGREIAWHPDFMRVRYENWIGGLSGDWLISRQRFFGVPIPVWYSLDENGDPSFDDPIVAPRDALPVDPSSSAPPGFAETQRGQAGGFVGEIDVMDTLMTSSLTPQLAGGWERDKALFDVVYPYDLRPQGQDIIRTWLFSTMLRSVLEINEKPWQHAALSGFIVDPARKKMSKSKGNVVTPAAMLDTHGPDAVRYWAASSRLGTDAAFDPQNPTQVKIGRRLAIKILNASKFILGFEAYPKAHVTEALDLSMLTSLAKVVDEATDALPAYDHARALETTETFFWTFCDDYLELVKDRAYGERDGGSEQASAVAALRLALSTMLRLFAPFVPFATEEAWSWWNDGSIHRAAWPTSAHLNSVSRATGRNQNGDPDLLPLVGLALTHIRRAKTDAKISPKAGVTSAVITGTAKQIEKLAQVERDLKAVGKIDDLMFVETDELSLTRIELAPDAK